MIRLVLLLLVAGAVMLQLSLPVSYLPLDLVYLVVVFAGLQRGGVSGLSSGILGGLLLDSLVSPRLGPRLVSLALIGAVADSLSGSVNREQPRLQLVSAALLSLLHDLILYAMASALDISQGGPRRWALYYVLPRLLLHALASIPFYFVFRAIIRARVFQDPLTRPPLVIRKMPG